MNQPTYEIIVNNWNKLTFIKVFFGALILLIAINVIGAISEDTLVMQAILPLSVPIFLALFFVKYKYHSLGIAFISFLLFSFLGDVSSMFFSKENLIQTSSIFYFLSYLYLIIIVLPKFKLIEVNKLIGAYLLVVFIINIYFLYIIYGILNAVIPDNREVLLFGIKSLALIILAFVSFGVYLNTQSRQSALFLTSVIFFGFATILNYINLYYLYNWSFELLQRMLYTVGLYILFRYVIIETTIKKPVEIKERYSSDNILA